MTWISELRRELAVRAQAIAELEGVVSYASLGRSPTVLFEEAPDGGTHANFHPKSWRRILANPEWAGRLAKPHQRKSALPTGKRERAREMDSSNSSDALLMNCFCFPSASGRMLGTARDLSSTPSFGCSPQVLLVGGRCDATEIDMCWDGVFVEAKLTESGFTRRREAVVTRYAMLSTVFDVGALPRSGSDVLHYQLIRNVLAAHQHGADFVLLIDKRRPDLEAAWQAIYSCIKSEETRARCQSRTWQQVAAAAPGELRDFLQSKYGIVG